MSWNEKNWLDQWNQAIEVKNKQDRRSFTRPLLASVFKDTVEKVRQGGYHTAEGWVDLNLNKDIEAQTVFYDMPVQSVQTDIRDKASAISVMPVDCLELARDIAAGNPDAQVCVLNLASYSNPGGGVYDGAAAQEEYLFRCSDYFRSLYQYADFASMYGVKQHSEYIYPLHNEYGAVFSRGITVFRDIQARGYKLLERPFKVNMLAAAAHRNPKTVTVGGEVRYTRAEEAYMINKVRTILRIAYENGQTHLVLGALGCGAFHNPPKQVAQIFKKVLQEPEFRGIFQYVYFAIINDHNSNGNYEAFEKVFSSRQ